MPIYSQAGRSGKRADVSEGPEIPIRILPSEQPSPRHPYLAEAPLAGEHQYLPYISRAALSWIDITGAAELDLSIKKHEEKKYRAWPFRKEATDVAVYTLML